MSNLIRTIKNKLKVKAGFDWNNIGKVVDCDGDEQKLTYLGGNKVKVEGDGVSHTLPAHLALSLVNVYDKQGNLVNNMEDYQ